MLLLDQAPVLALVRFREIVGAEPITASIWGHVLFTSFRGFGTTKRILVAVFLPIFLASSAYLHDNPNQYRFCVAKCKYRYDVLF